MGVLGVMGVMGEVEGRHEQEGTSDVVVVASFQEVHTCLGAQEDADTWPQVEGVVERHGLVGTQDKEEAIEEEDTVPQVGTFQVLVGPACWEGVAFCVAYTAA